MSEPNGQLTPAEVQKLIRAELPTLKVDQGKIKLSEWEALEDASDRPVIGWLGVSHPPIWFIRGQIWLWLRRTHPELTYEVLADIDVDLLLEAIKLKEPEDEGSDADPTGGSAEPKPATPKPRNSRASATSGG